MLRKVNHSSALLRLQNNNCKYTTYRTFGLNFGETVQFPRAEINSALNWSLAKYLVTPRSGNVLVNTSDKGGLTDGSSQVNKFDDDTNWPKSVHIEVAKNISASESVYVEDGVFMGFNCRVITANASQASKARANLESMVDGNVQAESFAPKVVVLLDTVVGAETYVNVARGLVVSGGFYDVDFRGALSELI